MNAREARAKVLVAHNRLLGEDTPDNFAAFHDACAAFKRVAGKPETDDYVTHHTVRSRCQNARLTYQPDWSPTKPWASYQCGTAGAHYGTLEEGIAALTKRGYRFDKIA